MNKTVSMQDIAPLITLSLENGGEALFTVTGTSMLPLLHAGKDSVVITKPLERLKKYDIPLYRRKSGEYILHRVVKVLPDGYEMCGDHQWIKEHGIDDSQIIGTVKQIVRHSGRRISVNSLAYRSYCIFWVLIRPIRKYFYFISAKLFKKAKK